MGRNPSKESRMDHWKRGMISRKLSRLLEDSSVYCTGEHLWLSFSSPRYPSRFSTATRTSGPWPLLAERIGQLFYTFWCFVCRLRWRSTIFWWPFSWDRDMCRKIGNQRMRSSTICCSTATSVKVSWFFVWIFIVVDSVDWLIIQLPSYTVVNWLIDWSIWTVCTYFSGFKAPRAHHCRQCGRCIQKMEHHCPWINNCGEHCDIIVSFQKKQIMWLFLSLPVVVGHRNHAYFLRFLFFATCGCLQAFTVLILVILRVLNYVFTDYHYNRPLSRGRLSFWARLLNFQPPPVFFSVPGLLWIVMTVGFAFGVVLAVGALFVIQLRIILKNETSIESWILNKASYYMSEESAAEDAALASETSVDQKKKSKTVKKLKFENPYHLGWWKNLQQVSWGGGKGKGF